MELKFVSWMDLEKLSASSNRTFMELKFGWYPIPLISIRGSNRTFMELK